MGAGQVGERLRHGTSEFPPVSSDEDAVPAVQAALCYLTAIANEPVAMADEGTAGFGQLALQFLELIGDVKRLPRTGWIREGIHHPETVGAHMFRVCCAALLASVSDMQKDIVVMLMSDRKTWT